MNDPRLWWTDKDTQSSIDMGLLSEYTLQRGDPAQMDREEAESLALQELLDQCGDPSETEAIRLGRFSWEE